MSRYYFYTGQYGRYKPVRTGTVRRRRRRKEEEKKEKEEEKKKEGGEERKG